MILLSHPTGNANVRNAALAFAEAGVLGRFLTTLAIFEGTWSGSLAGLPGLAELRKRSYPAPLRPFTECRPALEILRLLSSRAGWRRWIQKESGMASIDRVYGNLDEWASTWIRKGNFSGAYCYEDGAKASFQAMKERGGRCFYDLPIAHWSKVRQLLIEERERWPDWAPTLGGLADSPRKLERKNQELDLADVVICPSGFVRSSLPRGVRETKKVLVVPFGSPAILGSPPPGGRSKPDPILKVLFAGSLSQRKGLADLFAAIRMLDSRKIELHVMGQPMLPMTFYKERCPGFIHHPPRSHSEVLDLMRTCDVLVLPSIAEGRALVQQEAMACGLPVIATRNAGAEDLLQDETAGFLVPVGSPESIAEKLDLLARDRNLLAKMSSAAVKTAAGLTWENYRERLREGLFSEDFTELLP